MQLVDLRQHIPDAIIDMRYASAHNIAGRPLQHSLVAAQLDASAAQQLVVVADQLRAQGLRLVVWDAYRPPEVQLQLRALQSDTKYVAKNSNHTKGLAIDATLADAAGKYLNMGTDHDEFSERAHVQTDVITDEQAANRQILTGYMTQAGFTQWPYEWWHFDYVG